MVDVPEATKCCFCLPLRRGLLAWVYFKLAILLSITLIILIPLNIILNRYIDGILFILLLVAYVLIAIEIVFELIFIISAHKKKHKYLKLYCQYEVVMLCSEFVLCVLYLWYAFIQSAGETHLVGSMVGGLVVILALLALHTYFVYLVRSEVRKLELSAQFTFKNLTNDPECSVQILGDNLKEAK